MTLRDLLIRYKQTVMGIGWAIFMPLVNTATSELSYLVGTRAIEELPLNGRNYTDLAFLQPGVIAFPHRDGGSVVAHGLAMSVNGQDPRSNVHLLDGTLLNDLTNGPAGSAGAWTWANAGRAIDEHKTYTRTWDREACDNMFDEDLSCGDLRQPKAGLRGDYKSTSPGALVAEPQRPWAGCSFFWRALRAGTAMRSHNEYKVRVWGRIAVYLWHRTQARLGFASSNFGSDRALVPCGSWQLTQVSSCDGLLGSLSLVTRWPVIGWPRLRPVSSAMTRSGASSPA